MVSDNMIVFGKKTLFLALTAALTSCGIFSPRDSDKPEPAGRTDPLSFSSIMVGTGYQFSKLQYEDLFCEDLVYVDINSSSFLKTQMIQKLQLIQRQNPEIQVQWTTRSPIWKSNDTMYLNGFTYKITNIPDFSNDTGSSDFIVVRENADWHILQWRDYPVLQGKSFYSPP